MAVERTPNELRLQAIVDELADAAGFAERPRLIIKPAWQMPGATATALVDLHGIQASAALADRDEIEVRCILAHELGHLWQGHGRGAFWGALLIVGGAVLGGLVGWLAWGFGTGAYIFLGGLALRYLHIAICKEAYRANWVQEPQEAEAEAFARRLVGQDAYADFCARSRARGIERPGLAEL